MYNYVKALHIIFIVTWFAGLFYMPRLLIYHREAQDKSEPEKKILSAQFAIMLKRLWFGITWPSAILTLLFGIWMAYLYSYIPVWLWAKLAFVVFLYAYHMYTHRLYKKQISGSFPFSSAQLRIWNEVATIFLVAIVFIVNVKNAMSALWAIIGLLIFVTVLLVAIRIYKKRRSA